MREENLKTGTTCIGLLYKDGVLLAADRRVTSYKINSDKFTKLFDLSDNVVATVSGGVADAQRFIRAIRAELKLKSLRAERKPYVKEAEMILNSMQYSGIRTQGSVVALIIGGYTQKEGFVLQDLSPDGSIIPNEGFVSNGSGSLYANTVLETNYKKDMSEAEALKLIEKAFLSAFKNDTASGGGFIAKIINKDGIREVSKKIIRTELVNE